MNHMLSVASLEQSDFHHLIERGCEFARNPFSQPKLLAGRSVGIEFRKTSTRTRTSFATAAVRLGAAPILFGPADLQTNTGETLQDTVAVLSHYLAMLILRTAADPAELRLMAQCDALPIINAMTSDEHPTQALTDISMLRRQFGELSGLRVLYSGEGNNTAVALAYAVSRCNGMEIDFRTPDGYAIPPEVLERCSHLGKRFGGRVSHSHTPPDTRDTGYADVVYVTRWQTTGTAKSDPAWRERFRPFAMGEALMASLSRTGKSVFMHDLPAVRGEDCASEVLDGNRSIAFKQAEQKLFTAMAVIEWCAQDSDRTRP